MDKPCTLLVHFDKGTAAMANAIKAGLEGSDVAAKVEAMKRAVMLLLNSETLPTIFATVVRHVLPTEDHTIQKLLLLYLEIIDKRDAAGRIPPEMILVCQNLRNNLQHPNEYIRGATLRFLCRLSVPEMLEPIVPSILENLDRRRHHFIRRHAISAVSAIYRLPHGVQLIPNAPELAERALASEQDPSARRNAFLMICHCDQERAVAYLISNADRVTGWPDLLQMAALDLIRKRKLCSSPPNRADKGRYIKIIISLLSSPSTAVAYECAGALASLPSAPSAVRAAANTYCHLLSSQCDENVSLVLLDRVNELSALHRDVMVDVAMDVLRALSSSPSLDVKRKVLDSALRLLTPRNMEEVVLYLNEEVVKTQSGEELDKEVLLYRRMLLQAMHACAVEFPKVAGSVLHLLMDFFGLL